MRNLIRLLRNTAPHRRPLIVGFLAAIGVSVATVVQPIIVREAIDNGVVGRDAGALVRMILAFLAAGATSATLFFVRRRNVGRFSYCMQADIRQRFFDHVQTLDTGFHHRMSAGQLMSRGTADLQSAGDFLMTMPWMLNLSLQVALALVAMFALDAPLAAVATALLPLIVVAGRAFSKRFDPVVWRIQERLGEFAALVEQTVIGIRVVKAFGREEHQTARARDEASQIREAALEGIRLQARYVPFFSLVPQLAVVALLWFGGRRVLGHDITLGTLVAFNTYVSFLVWPLQELGHLFTMCQRAATASGRIFEVLDTAPAIADAPGATVLQDPRGHVRLEGVRLTLPGGRRLLDGVDLDVPAGESLAIVGPTGSGKSTLLDLIARFSEPDDGVVAIDGRDVRNVTLRSLRRHVGVVFEDTFLFSDSIAANIAYGRPDVTQDEISRAAGVAQADGFIRELPRGYSTPVGEHGYSLSGGQRQRVALARAVLVDPRVLLLDDATSSVDARIEAAIRRGLAEAMRGRTTILVARRPSSAALAGRVAFLRDGRILATGTHQELWATLPEYREVLGGTDGALPAPVAASVAHDVPEPAPEPPPPAAGDEEQDTSPRHFGRRELAVVWPALRPELRRTAVALGMLVASQLAALASPFLLRYAIDTGIARSRVSALDRAALAMLVLAVGAVVIQRGSIRLAGRAGQNALRRLRERVFAHMASLDLAYFERERTGVIVSRLTADLQTVENLVSEGLVWAGSASLYLVGSIVVLLVMDLPMAAVSLAVMGPGLVASTVVFRRASERAYARVRRTTAAVLTGLQETLRGVAVVQAFAREEGNSEAFARHNASWRDANIASWRISAVYFPVVELAGVVAVASALAYGGWQVLQGGVTVGVLSAFVLYLSSITGPIHGLSQMYDSFQGAMAGLSRVAGLLEERPELVDHGDARDLPAASGRLSLERVAFRYAPEAPLALAGVDLDATPGSVVALVGETGAGKSTIAKLLLRFYDPTTGTVRLDGRDLRDVTRTSRTRHTALVPQEGYLFAGTVRENIRFGRPEATDEDIEALCRTIGIEDVVRSLPSGYGTDIGSLSGGERQMIALARALVADPRVLVLDEATSALDPGTEARIQRALDHAFRDRTTILIAHRLSTVMRADSIVVVQRGRIAETGTHDELVGRPDGVYASLFTHWLVNA